MKFCSQVCESLKLPNILNRFSKFRKICENYSFTFGLAAWLPVFTSPLFLFLRFSVEGVGSSTCGARLMFSHAASSLKIGSEEKPRTC